MGFFGSLGIGKRGPYDTPPFADENAGYGDGGDGGPFGGKKGHGGWGMALNLLGGAFDGLAQANGMPGGFVQNAMKMKQMNYEQNKPYRFQNNNGDVVEVNPRTGDQKVLYKDTPKADVPSSVKEIQYYRSIGRNDIADNLEAKQQLVFQQVKDPASDAINLVGVSPSSIINGGNSTANLPKISSPEERAKLPPGSKYIAPDGSVRTVPGGASPSNGSGGFHF